MIIVKQHIKGKNSILALCDKELLGKKYEEADLQIDTTSNFYQGEEMSKEDIKKIIFDFRIINAVGQRSINLLLELELISRDRILTIKDISIAQAINQKNYG